MTPEQVFKKFALIGLLQSVLAAFLVALASAQQDPFGWARDYTQKAVTAGKAREAAKELEIWAVEFEKSGDVEKASIYLTQASFAAQASGQLEHGRNLARRGYEIAERSKDAVQQARAVTALVQALNSLRQQAQVRDWLDRGFAAAAQITHAVTREAIEAGFFLTLGNLQLRDGRVKEAIENIAHGVRLRDSLVSHFSWPGGGATLPAVQTNLVIALATLANAYGRANMVAEALATNERGLELTQKFALQSFSGIQTTFHLQIGRLQLRRRLFDQAEHHLRAAVDGATRQRQPLLLSSASHEMGNLLLQTRRPGEAIPFLRNAIESVEQTRARLSSEDLRSAFFEDKDELYRRMILAQLRTKNFTDAFNYNERARSRAFLDVLGSSAQLASGRVLDAENALRNRVSALTERLNNADPSQRERMAGELDQAVKNHHGFLAKIRQENREQASLMSVEPLTLKQVQELLEPGTAILEYFVGPEAVHTWIVEKDRVEFVSLDLRRPDLVARVHFLRDLIAQPDKVDGFKRESAELHKLLIAPALQHVRAKELVIVPHDVLHYLPFQALVSGQGKYLVEEFPISYLSSASLMQFTRGKRRASRESTLAMGNPNLGDDAYNLRFAEREAKEIAQAFPQSSIYLRDEATKARALAAGPKNDIVHFAVHAEFNEKDPLSSALLLAKAGQDDGRLKVSEIFGLNLKADLVVLSACETGLGKINSGDEIVGMTRAFIYAGTPSVITTLWKVNDRTSYELMGEFYRNLKSMKKSEALRQAQLKTMKEYPQPLYWAAYQLTGES